MTYPTDEETFDNRVSPEFVRDDHLNLIQSFLKRIQDFIGYGGRLHDSSGLVMPVGSIIAYTGDSAPSGWLMCDGKQYQKVHADYSDLFAVIGVKYGSNIGSDFNVPDFRGMFLRGSSKIEDQEFLAISVNVADDYMTGGVGEISRSGMQIRISSDDTLPGGLAINTTYYSIIEISTRLAFATTRANAIAGIKIDLTTQGAGTHTVTAYLQDDKDTRLKSTIGSSDGEDIGSYQDDALQGHYHKVLNDQNWQPHALASRAQGAFFANTPNAPWNAARMNAKDIYDDPNYGVARVAVETRARNVYVNYIIKR